MDHLRLLSNEAHSKYKLLIKNIDNRLDKIYGLSDEDKGNVALQSSQSMDFRKLK